MSKPQKGKTYKATLKGAPNVSFEIYMRFVDSYGSSADVTIDPKGTKHQIGGFSLAGYYLEEITPEPELPTGNYAVIGRTDGNQSFGHYTLHNGQWWIVFRGTAEKSTDDKVRESLGIPKWGILYEGVKKPNDPWE